MIIRIIATALVQCMIRTQPGWIILAGAAPVWASAAARLDVALDMDGSVGWRMRNFDHYTPAAGVRYPDGDAQFDISFHRTGRRSQKSEPGRTGSLLLASVGG